MHIQNKFGIILNHKRIRRYKNALNIRVIVRKRVSFSTSNRNNEELIIKSYKKIPKSNDVSNLINNDHLLYEYLGFIEKLGYTRSMSHRGHCWGNRPIENWFSQLKEEWIRPYCKMTMKQAEKEIKKYVKWYNTQRIQKKLNYLTPEQYRLNHCLD